MNIPRVSADDVCPEEFYDSYIKSGTPAILTGALTHWPLETTWTFEHLDRIHGELQVPSSSFHAHWVLARLSKS
jgi:hypothetical protein